MVALGVSMSVMVWVDTCYHALNVRRVIRLSPKDCFLKVRFVAGGLAC